MKRFNVRKSIVEHPDFVAALKSIEDVHQWLRESGEAGCLATIGESGAGKSTVLECYRAKFPVREEVGTASLLAGRIARAPPVRAPRLRGGSAP